MLNYSLHAIECFSQHFSQTMPADDYSTLEDLTLALKGAVKFELPDNGSLFADDFEKGYDIIDCDLLHLPFKSVALEYPYTTFDGTQGNIHIAKRIALCLDYEAHKYTRFGRSAFKLCERVGETGGIMLIPIFFMQELWFPYPWGVLIPRFNYDGNNMSCFTYGKGRAKVTKIGFQAFPVMERACKESFRVLPLDVVIKNALKDCGEEITSLVGLLAALSCSNVKMQDVPAPAKLNAKRVKNGKLPFFDYKTVYVDVHVSKTASSKGHNTNTGRLSPREHLRRGHIRRLQSGRNVWVQAAVIGSAAKGKIITTYAIK